MILGDKFVSDGSFFLADLADFAVPLVTEFFLLRHRYKSKLFNQLKFTTMDGSFVAIMFFLTFFGSLFGVLYFYFTTRNRERLALIEKNADPALFKVEPSNVFKKFSIKIGMLLMGGGFGVLVGNILTVSTRLEEPVAYISMIFMFAGAGLILSYFFARKVD